MCWFLGVKVMEGVVNKPSKKDCQNVASVNNVILQLVGDL